MIESYSKAWNRANPDKVKDYRRRYRASHSDKIAAYRKQYVSHNRDKHNARGAIHLAVHRGWLVRPIGKIFHHPDYSRRYYGAWVTLTEHGAIHSGEMECPSCIDYSPIIEPIRAEYLRAARSKAGFMTCHKRWGNGEK